MFICDKVEMNVFSYATQIQTAVLSKSYKENDKIEILSHAIPTGFAYFEEKIKIIYATQL